VDGPYLIFDKSSLEGLNFEAVMLDNFFSSVITPIFLRRVPGRSLKREITRSKSTPGQLVGGCDRHHPSP
jgi:hypothetical protein